MKIAIGIVLIVFGVLMIIYGIVTKAAFFVINGGKTSGMLNWDPYYYLYSPLLTLIYIAIIIAGCVIFERGIKEE